MIPKESESDCIYVVPEEEGERLDKVLAKRFPSFSRQYFQHVIESGLVLINGKVAKKATPVVEADEIEIEFTLPPPSTIKAEPIALDILYEDEDLLAVNKPAGMVVHPASGNWSGTFVHALLYHLNQETASDTMRPGIVHRLDKETSGVLIAAKNEKTQRKLVSLFSERKIKKEYHAICIGHPGKRVIVSPIGRHPVKRKEMTVLPDGGKEAITLCETVAHRHSLSLVRLFPETGRTHQLRVHLKSIGCPILGDSLYGNKALNKKWGAKRQLLHAYQLILSHPSSNDELVIRAPLPEDFSSFIRKIASAENSYFQ